MNEFEELYKEYSNKLYRYLVFLTKNENDAEDLLHESFIVAIKNIDKFKGQSSLSTWLFSIARNLYLNWLRKSNKRETIDIEKVISKLVTDEQCESKILEKESLKILMKSIEKLDESYKEVIVLRAIENLSYKEIALIVGKSERWARVIFHRGKLKLKDILDMNEVI